MKNKSAEEILLEEIKKFSSPLDANGLQLLVINVANQHAINHVKAALEEVKNNILHKELSVNWNVFDKSGMLLLDDEGIEDFEKSILNSYPLEKIK